MQIDAQYILCKDQSNFESMIIIHATHRILETVVHNNCYFYWINPISYGILPSFPAVTEWNHCVWWMIPDLANLSMPTPGSVPYGQLLVALSKNILWLNFLINVTNVTKPYLPWGRIYLSFL